MKRNSMANPHDGVSYSFPGESQAVSFQSFYTLVNIFPEMEIPGLRAQAHHP